MLFRFAKFFHLCESATLASLPLVVASWTKWFSRSPFEVTQIINVIKTSLQKAKQMVDKRGQSPNYKMNVWKLCSQAVLIFSNGQCRVLSSIGVIGERLTHQSWVFCLKVIVPIWGEINCSARLERLADSNRTIQLHPSWKTIFLTT